MPQPSVQIVLLRGREAEPRVAELLATAQIHRPLTQRSERGPAIAAWYAEHDEAELWGCEQDGELVAIAGVDPTHVDGAMLMDLAVLDRRQRGGFGSALIAFLRDRFPERPLFGNTVDSALGFYQRLGFETAQTASYGLVEAEAQRFYVFRLPPRT